MKRFNGYYGCTLCEMRGKHQFRSHSYPHNEEIEMRNPDRHYRQAVYFERGDVEERRKKKEKDPEIKTKGVQGYPEIFKVLSDLPLSAPADTMHQLLKGVAKDLLEFLFEVSGYPVEVENATKALKLPSDFKHSLRSLHELKHFKQTSSKLTFSILHQLYFGQS